MRLRSTGQSNINNRYFLKEKANTVSEVGRGKTMNLISTPRQALSASTATRHYLGRLLDSACLSTDELQINHNSQVERHLSKIRTPTALVTLPAHGILVIGFDSGEIQTYDIGIYDLVHNGKEPKINVAVPGPCLRVSENKPILFLKQLEGWNPFIQDGYIFQNGNNQNGHDKHQLNKYSVFYGATTDSSSIFVFWVINNEVNLSRIRYQLPGEKYRVTEGVLCPGIGKMIAATDRGFLFVFSGRVDNRINTEYSLAGEQIESKHIIKVAHEECVTTLACNEKGNLIISGGTDGRVCIWQWGRDEFLHRAGEIYVTNLPIQSAKFNNPNDDEITVSIESHVMNLKVTRKSSQLYAMKQQPSVHIKLQGRHGLSSPFSIVQIEDEENPGSKSFLILRTSKIVEIISTATVDKSLLIDERPTGLCVDQQQTLRTSKTEEDKRLDEKQGKGKVILTSVALLASHEEPIIYTWMKCT